MKSTLEEIASRSKVRMSFRVQESRTQKSKGKSSKAKKVVSQRLPFASSRQGKRASLSA